MTTSPGDLDAPFAALSDPTRRRIIELLIDSEPMTTSELVRRFTLSRWAVMKHLAVLRHARVVQTLPQGRRRLHFLDRGPLDLVDAWLSRLGW